MVVSSVCSYRKLRELVLSEVLVRLDTRFLWQYEQVLMFNVHSNDESGGFFRIRFHNACTKILFVCLFCCLSLFSSYYDFGVQYVPPGLIGVCVFCCVE